MNDYNRVKFGDPTNRSYFCLLTPTVDYGKIPPNGEEFLKYLEELKET